jgi:hypothetical protein
MEIYVNDEQKRMWKEAAMAYFKVLFLLCLEGLRETTKSLSQESRSPDRDLNPEPPEYEARLSACRIL